MKKIISILLTLTLCLSLTSFAWADGTEIVVGQDKTLAEAVNEANSGDTIKLPAGEYSLETITGAAGKNLTFIGAGKEATILTYGKVAGTGSDGGGGACYVFDGAGAITFKDVTLKDNVATKDYFRGFVRAASMTFEGCKFTNVAGYWGSGAVKFTNCEFVTEVADSFNMKCYSGTSFEFDGCTFKSPYGFIDAYRQQMLDGSVEIRVKNCEFIGTGDSPASKPAVRLCDYTNAAEGGAWGAYFTGTNVVTNVQEDAVTGTNLYGCRFYDSNTPLLGTVYVEGNKVWESGAKVEIVAKIGNTTYPSLAEAVAAAKDGDTVTLLSNVSIDTPLNIAASITLELGDNTISYIGENARGIYIKNGADVTINANAAGGVTATTIALQVKAGGKLTVNGGVYNAQYAVAAFSSESAATETILNSGVFNGFIYTNGTGHDDHITINGGTYNKMLYLASGGKSTYTIKNGTFNTSLEIDAGTLNILGGTFKANVDTTNNANKPATNNNGSGAYEGIIVICKPDGSSSNGYIGDVVVNIKGGTFENTFPNGETIVVADFGKEEQGVGDAKVTISGSAKVIGKVVVYKSEDNTGAALAISGGTFSTDPSAYVTGDFTATKGPNGMWTVTQTVTPDPAPVDPQPERPAHTNRRYPANNTTTTTTDTKKDNVTSARTFDAGIAMYVGMSLLSVAGSAVVIGKKKEF